MLIIKMPLKEFTLTICLAFVTHSKESFWKDALHVAKSETSRCWHVGKRNSCVCNSKTILSVRTDCWVVVASLPDDELFLTYPIVGAM